MLLILISSPLGKILHRLLNSMFKAIFNKVHACTGLYKRLWRLLYRLKSLTTTRIRVFVFCGTVGLRWLGPSHWATDSKNKTDNMFSNEFICLMTKTYGWHWNFLWVIFPWSSPRSLCFKTVLEIPFYEVTMTKCLPVTQNGIIFLIPDTHMSIFSSELIKTVLIRPDDAVSVQHDLYGTYVSANSFMDAIRTKTKVSSW